MIYRWEELNLFTIQTLSNIITFIQFAFTPLEFITSQINQENQNNLMKSFRVKFASIIKIFSAPLDLIEKYNNIMGPIRAVLSALIFNTVIIYLYSIFFLPSWRFLILFSDIFIPGCFLFGIIFISRKYEEQKKISILLLIIGIFYFLIRITFFILHLFKRKNIKWHIKCASLISSVFLSRLKNNHDSHDEITEDIRYQIDQETTFIQFDKFQFSYKKRIIDFIITILIWIFILIFVILGWEKLLENSYKGKNLDDISFISNIITYFLFSGISLRLIFNIIWLIKPIENKVFKIFKFLHKLAYKGMHFLSGISLIPLLGIALKACNEYDAACGRYYYFDERSNADSFLTYFKADKGKEKCIPCTMTSVISDPSCEKACSINQSLPIFYVWIFSDSYIYKSTFQDLYQMPIFLFDFFYLSIFILVLLLINKVAMDILVILPAPTVNIECKFQTLINTLDSAPLNIFRSFRYKNSLYSISFSEAKLFVYFWTNFTFCGVLPMDYFINPILLSFVVSFTSFFIAESQIFTSPYISILHNIINFFSYAVSGISSLLVGLCISGVFEMPEQLIIFFMIFIIATPILTALITPFFVRKDPLLFPIKFDLLKIQKWDKKIDEIIDFRRKQSKAKKERKNQNEDTLFDNDGILFESEPSIPVSYLRNSEDEREHDFLVSNFDLIKLAPIQIQERLNNNNDDEFRKSVENLWPKININDEIFDKASNEMIQSSNQLIDCICYKNLIRLFNISLIFSSICLGWCLSSGIERWQKVLSPQASKYYLRCNMLVNGSFPGYNDY